jgi:AraC-like DNA-binding protein
MPSSFGRTAPSDPTYVLASAANGVAAVIEDLGGDPDRAFGRAGIDPGVLDEPLNPVGLRNYCHLLHEASLQTQHENFGLVFGSDFVPPRLGAIGYLTITAPTMSNAVRSLCGYFPAHQRQTVLEVRSVGDNLAIVYEVLDESVDRRQDAEFSIAAFWHMFRHCLGSSWAPLQVSFSHPAPSSREEHERLFGAPVEFNREANCFLFRRADLWHVMPTQDPLLYEIMLGLLRDRMPVAAAETVQPADGSARTAFVPDCQFIDQVRAIVAEQLRDGGPNLEETARRLFMSTTTLYRRLKDLGLTFHEIVLALRREHALSYMRDDTLSLTHIALLLGYSELSAFSRAFRHWTGMSPAQYRRSLGV